jgi:hypothetical protein
VAVLPADGSLIVNHRSIEAPLPIEEWPAMAGLFRDIAWREDALGPSLMDIAYLRRPSQQPVRSQPDGR